MIFFRKGVALLVTVIMCILIAGCIPQKQKAELVLQSIATGMESYGCPYFAGAVKNEGNGTAYNASINFTIYRDAEKTLIIGTAWDYLASGNDIGPGQSVVFHATAFDLSSVNDLQYYDYRLEWLNR